MRIMSAAYAVLRHVLVRRKWPRRPYWRPPVPPDSLHFCPSLFPFTAYFPQFHDTCADGRVFGKIQSRELTGICFPILPNKLTLLTLKCRAILDALLNDMKPWRK
jgi:hypothetical protein